jgi:Tfp pilus assembly protein PilP
MTGNSQTRPEGANTIRVGAERFGGPAQRPRRRGLTPFVVAVCAVLCGLGGAGCGDDDEETTTVRGTGKPIVKRGAAKPAVAKPAAGKPGVAKAGDGAAKVTEGGPFTYKPGRDPFQSYFDITGEVQQTAPLEPLQKHDLSKFKVTAIITGTVQPAAVLLDPSGKSHMIKRGSLLGPPRGRVAQILSDRIVVEREFKDRLERIHKLKSELKLRLDPEETKTQ